jgi:hypothetical protein
VFAKAAALPPAEQEVPAAHLLEEMADEDEVDRAIPASGEKLAKLARETLTEHRAGLTQKLDPDSL